MSLSFPFLRALHWHGDMRSDNVSAYEHIYIPMCSYFWITDTCYYCEDNFFSTSLHKTPQPPCDLSTNSKNPGVAVTIIESVFAAEVETLELLRALVPDTLRAKALNGATPAHDAAFQGHLKKGEILEIAAIKKRMLCIWDFDLVFLICVSWEWGFKISEMLNISNCFGSLRPRNVYRELREPKGTLPFWSSFMTLHQAHCWRDHM